MIRSLNFVSLFVIAGMMVVSSVAHAGTVVLTADGTASWTSTACVAPSIPSEFGGNPETPASAMNAGMVTYNDYVKAETVYMTCLSKEVSSDAAAANLAIVHAGQMAITAEEHKVESLGIAFKTSSSGQPTASVQ